MMCNTENGASLYKLADKSKIPGKRLDIIIGNWEKRKWNTKYFSETTRVD